MRVYDYSKRIFFYLFFPRLFPAGGFCSSNFVCVPNGCTLVPPGLPNDDPSSVFDGVPIPNPVDVPAVCVPRPLNPIPVPNPVATPRVPGVPNEVFKLDPSDDPRPELVPNPVDIPSLFPVVFN